MLQQQLRDVKYGFCKNFSGGGEKKNLLLKSSVVFKKAGVSRQMPKCNWHRELRGILIKNQIR